MNPDLHARTASPHTHQANSPDSVIYSCARFCDAHCVCTVFPASPAPSTQYQWHLSSHVTWAACCFCLTHGSELQESTSLDSHNQIPVSYHHPVEEDSGKQVAQTHPGIEWQQRKMVWVSTSPCPPWKCNGCPTASYLLIRGCNSVTASSHASRFWRPALSSSEHLNEPATSFPPPIVCSNIILSGH